MARPMIFLTEIHHNFSRITTSGTRVIRIHHLNDPKEQKAIDFYQNWKPILADPNYPIDIPDLSIKQFFRRLSRVVKTKTTYTKSLHRYKRNVERIE